MCISLLISPPLSNDYGTTHKGKKKEAFCSREYFIKTFGKKSYTQYIVLLLHI